MLEKKYTENKKLIVGKNDLLTWCKEHGEKGQKIIDEWDEQRNGSMSNYKPGSSRVAYWKCSICNEIYKLSVRSRVGGTIHGQCGRELGIQNLKKYHRERIKHEESLAFLYKDIIKEWDYEKNNELDLDPNYLKPGSSKKVNWICNECGEHYQQYIRIRVYGYGCKKCRNKLHVQ